MQCDGGSFFKSRLEKVVREMKSGNPEPLEQEKLAKLLEALVEESVFRIKYVIRSTGEKPRMKGGRGIAARVELALDRVDLPPGMNSNKLAATVAKEAERRVNGECERKRIA